MKYLTSAGVILYRIANKNEYEYLILEANTEKRNWTPAKGRVEEYESELEAAVRETKEEIGLVLNKDYTLESLNEKFQLKYKIKTSDSKTTKFVVRRLIYWLGKVTSENIEIRLQQDEIKSYKWSTIDDLSTFLSGGLLSMFLQVDFYLQYKRACLNYERNELERELRIKRDVDEYDKYMRAIERSRIIKKKRLF